MSITPFIFNLFRPHHHHHHHYLYNHSGVYLKWLSLDHIYITPKGRLLVGSLVGATLSSEPIVSSVITTDEKSKGFGKKNDDNNNNSNVMMMVKNNKRRKTIMNNNNYNTNDDDNSEDVCLTTDEGKNVELTSIKVINEVLNNQYNFTNNNNNNGDDDDNNNDDDAQRLVDLIYCQSCSL